ncbi:hypothetical protein [Glycomyces sp. NRRL B-16210]|uniref:hypothetical protein n=1 Tax=Glycomyces sp. NRRL B-16210 TaxID=1463821 RepID=UPI0004BED983|nr:hypothetical protein [Glycomyces sp. NRRL B-16210]
MSSTTAVTWKSALLWVTAIIAAIAAAGWFAVSCSPGGAGAERPVNEEEAALLAGMRERNLAEEPVALRMNLPVEGETIVVDAYLDWQTPMLYARVPDTRTADAEGHRLVQAVPGLMASRDDDEEAFAEARVPEDGWATRQMLSGATTPLDTTLDILASSLFTLTAEQADDPAALAEQATWREEGVIDGEEVDSFRAPIMVESAVQSGPAPEALYSLDADGTLRRFQVNTGEETLSAVDFLREAEFDATALVPIDLLGGPPIAPVAVDEDLAATIASLRSDNRLRSAEVAMTVPTGDDQVTTAQGSIDWRTMTAYLHLSDDAGERLFLARPGGFAILPTEGGALPEVPPTEGWETHALTDEDAAASFGPIESLVYRLLEMSAEEAEDAEAIGAAASLLRVDGTGEDATYVVEYPVAGDAEVPAGQSAFRYHVSGERLSGVEMMTYYGVAGAELEYVELAMVAIPWEVSEAIG